MNPPLHNLLCFVGILGVVATRLSCDGALSLADAAAVPIVAVGWSFQEWALHKYILHGAEVSHNDS